MIYLSIYLFFYFLVCVFSIHDYMKWSAKMSRWAEPGSSSAMWWVFSPISSGWCILEGPGWWGLRADAFSPEMGSLTSQDLEVSINGGTPKWIAYKWKIQSKWMIYGYPHFRKPPFFFTHLNHQIEMNGGIYRRMDLALKNGAQKVHSWLS